MIDPRSDSALERELTSWIHGDSFTCLAARSASRRGNLVAVTYPALIGGADATAALHRDVTAFIDSHLVPPEREFSSFAAIFRSPVELTEVGFEQALWDQLARLHQHEVGRWPLAAGFSADPADPAFAFSLAGHAFFVAGLNPAASRLSRRFSHPVLVFNSHAQFSRLKASGVYQRLQGHIRRREARLQGSVNPMLAEHGDSSEASQYSGRAVESDWTCPFPAPPE